MVRALVRLPQLILRAKRSAGQAGTAAQLGRRRTAGLACSLVGCRRLWLEAAQ